MMDLTEILSYVIVLVLITGAFLDSYTTAKNIKISDSNRPVLTILDERGYEKTHSLQRCTDICFNLSLPTFDH